MTGRHRNYLRVLGPLVLGGAVALATFNLLVDPFGAYPGTNLRALAPYRADLVAREAKAELAARGTFETLILGSSRMRMGIPVDHPAFGSSNVCNLALDGTTFTEIAGVLDFALKRNPVRRIILGADFHLFSLARGNDPTFELSRFNPHLAPAEYHGRNLLGARASGEAWALAKAWLRGRPPVGGRRGAVPKFLPERIEQREAFARRVRASLSSLGAEGSFVHNPECFEAFRQLVRRCRQQNIELLVVVPPLHALQLEVVHATGHWASYETWKRAVVQILHEEGGAQSPLWDFQGFHGAVAEAVPPAGDRQTRMKYYLEASHFTFALGELVLDRILGATSSATADAQFGVPLTLANLDQHLLRTQQERQAYAAQNPSEIAWIKDLASSTPKAGGAASGEGAP